MATMRTETLDHLLLLRLWMEPHDGVLRGRLVDGPVVVGRAFRGVDEIAAAVRLALEDIELDLAARDA
jgi:hypothetical protein